MAKKSGADGSASSSRAWQFDLLWTSTVALYEEVDKLAKKAPKETLSTLTLRMVNQAIEDTKAFLPDDAYLKTVTRFEPAGDNPEYRDAVLVVGQLVAALKRFRASQPYDFSEYHIR